MKIIELLDPRKTWSRSLACESSGLSLSGGVREQLTATGDRWQPSRFGDPTPNREGCHLLASGRSDWKSCRVNEALHASLHNLWIFWPYHWGVISQNSLQLWNGNDLKLLDKVLNLNWSFLVKLYTKPVSLTPTRYKFTCQRSNQVFLISSSSFCFLLIQS